MSGRTWLAAILAMLVAAGCATQPSGGPDGPRDISYPDDEDYRHVTTKLVLAARLGAYRRTGITWYDRDGYNVSGAYELADSVWAVATVYHYPFADDESFPTYAGLAADFKAFERDIEEAWDDAALLEESEHSVVVNGVSLPGFEATYEIASRDAPDVRMLSYAHLYALDNWVLGLQFTHLEVDAAEVVPLQADLIAAITWPNPEGARPPDPAPGCIGFADSYERVARNQDRGLTGEQQVELIEGALEIQSSPELRTLMYHALEVANVYADLTSYQVRKLVLDDCDVTEAGMIRLNRLWGRHD